MSSLPSQPRILERGTWQYLESGEITTHKRKKGTEQWNPIERAPDTNTEDAYKVCVVRHNQAEGEPKHWSLFVYREGESEGMNLEVRGDHLFMTHHHAEREDVFQTDAFRDQFDIATVTKAQRDQIWTVAHQIPAPRAETQAEVTENCQGWTIRMVQWLVEQGIVNATWVESLQKLKDPL